MRWLLLSGAKAKDLQKRFFVALLLRMTAEQERIIWRRKTMINFLYLVIGAVVGFFLSALLGAGKD